MPGRFTTDAASIGADPAPVNIRNELISGGNTE